MTSLTYEGDRRDEKKDIADKLENMTENVSDFKLNDGFLSSGSNVKTARVESNENSAFFMAALIKSITSHVSWSYVWKLREETMLNENVLWNTHWHRLLTIR